MLGTWFVLDDMSRHSTRRHGQRTSQVHLAWPAASGEISVLRADHNLLRPGCHPWPGVDACSAARLDHVRSSLLEDFEIAFAHTVIARLLGTKLDVERH